MIRCKKEKYASGKIHSLESFGTQDGPGIRYVVFMQGCLARCLYCQNPDTWDMSSGKSMSPGEVFDNIEKCIPYLKSSKGGVTFSGGEPLLQPDFLMELLKICRKHSIHTAIDTAAFYPDIISDNKIDDVIKNTDLFIVDIKAAEQELHKNITSRDLEEVSSFIKKLDVKKKKYWLRYVLVPGLNDSRENIAALKELISGFKHCAKLEFLPYHTLGKHKWEALGLKYPLSGVPPAGREDIRKAEQKLA
jgi:pyruvate formate lyase activating enzyme